jgi:hypothetical protein
MLLFIDESEALTHPYLARAWAKRRADLRVPAPSQAKEVAMMGALDHAARSRTRARPNAAPISSRSRSGSAAFIAKGPADMKQRQSDEEAVAGPHD